ncbi:MAG: hypothetical protein ACR2PI_26370 [Hyphomicrobiaceae bacterium]
MIDQDVLRAVPPRALAAARAIAHLAVQLLTRAARANLPAAADDSHSNLGWDPELSGFLSQPLLADGTKIHIGATLDPLRLIIVEENQLTAELGLDGRSENDASTWLDAHLGTLRLNPATGATLPYDLPADVASISVFDVKGQQPALAALSGWYGIAHEALTSFAARIANLSPGPSPVRCWPHHFDIATYVSLEIGDAETARGIGVGLSPGDESYDQPYLYINPWPHLHANVLPDLPRPGHWHTQGFVGAIATADAILDNNNLANLAAYIDRTFDIARQQLLQDNR